ncbi:iron-sulfur cluster repair protein YtfE [Stutzerimonas nosocomialis]|uniref:Iron-sulfur cluster repair protein YtfE n=1 Tax=Stutzerimonas nosocomialis TaxID=1056496 RepID=A0A5R9QCA2_9GAMM|nr:iron-sulfur cluster repair protein YtfE [Stutzerimonas nosocomialis]TLX56083.1 iron-sulfur cluster repair protein YtfE [Stutzerimonas nosocomialis]TLX57602.1 iron-sulfur cluster repair protein YtfE [Stutzerimonas nosocomialis]TLX62721.1 iron-sulfur cluster repair protein YtfE [Stutzerimonas nosocomialis]
MTLALLERTLGDLACSLPGATRVLRQHKLDFCCAGGLTLGEAAMRQALDAERIADELAALDAQSGDPVDWRQTTHGALIDHLLARYHERHREQFPELIRLAARVEQVHGERSECPRGLAEHLWQMQQELESHMLKEEKILFPLLRRDIGSPQASGPISVMRLEHDQHGEALARLAELTNNITPPAHACNTWRALYRGLDELRDDLMQHIHLENNILFPCAVRG